MALAIPVKKPWTKPEWVSSHKKWQPRWRKWSAQSKWNASRSKWAATSRWNGPKRRQTKKEHLVPADFVYDKVARYSGTVTDFYKWKGYGWIDLDQQGVVPTDSIWVQWKNIQSEDRFPCLVKGMRVEFGIMSRREDDGNLSLCAKFVTLPGLVTVALQDELDSRTKIFVGDMHTRYSGKLDWYSPKSALGWVTVCDEAALRQGVPKELRVDEEEVNCGGKRPWQWLENVIVEFGIHKLKNGSCRAYNMTLPGRVPIVEENMEKRNVIGPEVLNGQITYWNPAQSWGLLKLDSSSEVPRTVQVKAKPKVKTSAKGPSLKNGTADVIYFRKSDVAKSCWPKKGLNVTFQLYTDVKGVGAINVCESKDVANSGQRK